MNLESIVFVSKVLNMLRIVKLMNGCGEWANECACAE
jgi:hypothetical protein